MVRVQYSITVYYLPPVLLYTSASRDSGQRAADRSSVASSSSGNRKNDWSAAGGGFLSSSRNVATNNKQQYPYVRRTTVRYYTSIILYAVLVDYDVYSIYCWSTSTYIKEYPNNMFLQNWYDVLYQNNSISIKLFLHFSCNSQNVRFRR